MEKIDRRSCSTLAKTLGTIVSISGAFIVTLYKGPPQLMTASVDLLSHSKLFLPQSNWVIGGILLGFYCVVAAAFLIVQASVLKKDPVELIIVFYYCFFVAIQSVVVLWFVERDSSAWALNPKLRLFAVLYSGVFGSAFQVGLFSLVPLRKVMVMDYKLTYPSRTATTMLINSFHTKSGAELAGKQVQCLGKYLSMSLIWSCFKWFFSGIGDSCGLYLRFGSIRNVCLQIFIAIALILGDGPYNLIKIIAITIKEICNKSSKQCNLPLVKEKLDGESSEVTLEQKKRDEVFLKDRIPRGVH